MLIFLAIAVAAFIIIAGAFLFGHDHEIGAGHDVAHEVAGESEGTVSIFSTRVIFTFVMGFGAFGAIAHHFGRDYVISSLCGAGGGIVLAAAMYGILALFAKQESTSVVSTTSFVGCTGTVIVPIDKGGIGEVGLSAGGQYRTCTAREMHGAEIPKGRSVRVVAVSGDDLIVEEITG